MCITLNNESKARQLITGTPLDWKVEKRPLFFHSHKGEVRGKKSDWFTMVREDNENELGVVKEGYTPVQNIELVDLLVTYFDDVHEGVNLEKDFTAKVFDGGKFVTLELITGEFEVAGKQRGDTIQQKVILKDRKDGHGSMTVGIGDTVLSCTNGMVSFNVKGSAKFRHTQSIEQKINNFERLWNRANQQSEIRRSVYHTLANTQITHAQVMSTVAQIVGFDMKEYEEQSSRKQNEFDAILENVEREMNEKGSTAWGLYNGVTFYTNHELGQSATQAERQEKLYHQKGYRLNQKAYELVGELATS